MMSDGAMSVSDVVEVNTSTGAMSGGRLPQLRKMFRDFATRYMHLAGAVSGAKSVEPGSGRLLNVGCHRACVSGRKKRSGQKQ